MPTITRFEDIEAWKTARELTKMVYFFTDQGKFAKDFGLRNQIQRASVSMLAAWASSSNRFVSAGIINDRKQSSIGGVSISSAWVK